SLSRASFVLALKVFDDFRDYTEQSLGIFLNVVRGIAFHWIQCLDRKRVDLPVEAYASLDLHPESIIGLVHVYLPYRLRLFGLNRRWLVRLIQQIQNRQHMLAVPFRIVLVFFEIRACALWAFRRSAYGVGFRRVGGRVHLEIACLV